MSQIEIKQFYVAVSDIHHGDLVKYETKDSCSTIRPTSKTHAPSVQIIPFIGEAEVGDLVMVSLWDNVAYAHEAYTRVTKEQVDELVSKFKGL